MAAHGPKGYRHAARHADIWSCYAMERSDVGELGPRVAAFEAACAEVGRDPATVGRSAGVVVAPLATAEYTGMFGSAITGSAGEIADAFRTFRDAGFTQLEFMFEPQTREALEAMAPVLELLGAELTTGRIRRDAATAPKHQSGVAGRSRPPRCSGVPETPDAAAGALGGARRRA